MYVVIALWPIVSNSRLGYFKLADHDLPYESDNIFILDGGEGFNFYPFTKIVGGNQ